MNCERCQELISELLDGALNPRDAANLNLHLEECLDCASVRDDLESVLNFCRADRGSFDAPANAHALWLRIRNTLEATTVSTGTTPVVRKSSWLDFFNRSWQLSFPQLAASVAAIIIVVALTTVVGIHRIESNGGTENPPAIRAAAFNLNERMWQQQQTISYWNNRVIANRARWSPQMRDTFDRNLSVIDQALNDSLNELNKNPHDDVSEEMLNAALNEKIALLKEFSELE